MFKGKLTRIKSLHKNSCQLDCKLKPEPLHTALYSVYSVYSVYISTQPLHLDRGTGSGGVSVGVGAGAWVSI